MHNETLESFEDLDNPPQSSSEIVEHLSLDRGVHCVFGRSDPIGQQYPMISY
jgi:hypothetical protein